MTRHPEASHSRWPRRLYGVGTEPDPRFTLANERTFLAWIRTSLALMAGGVGVKALNAAVSPHNESPLQIALAALLIGAGVICSAAAVRRWMSTERALRERAPLPAPRLAPLLGYGLALVGALACVLVLFLGV